MFISGHNVKETGSRESKKWSKDTESTLLNIRFICLQRCCRKCDVLSGRGRTVALVIMM